jgi:biotin operon repressor
MKKPITGPARVCPLWIRDLVRPGWERVWQDIYSLEAHSRTGTAFPSTRYLAKTTGLSQNTVVTAIARLKEIGALIVAKSPGTHSVYQTVVEDPRANVARVPSQELVHTIPISGTLCAPETSSKSSSSNGLHGQDPDRSISKKASVPVLTDRRHATGQNGRVSTHSKDLPNPFDNRMPFGSFCRLVGEEWAKVKPGARVPKGVSWALKILHESLDGPDELRAVFDLAKRRWKSDDQYQPGGWTRPENQTLAHIAKNLESLLNDPTLKNGAAANGWTPERIARVQAETALREVGIVGVDLDGLSAGELRSIRNCGDPAGRLSDLRGGQGVRGCA